jgi:hypothetical protein
MLLSNILYAVIGILLFIILLFDQFRHSGDTIMNIIIVFNFVCGLSRLFGSLCLFVLYKKMRELARCIVY